MIPLHRGSRFPRHIPAGSIYAFDPVSDEEMQGYLADARELAAILGFPAGPGTGGTTATWMISDPLSAHYGEEVPVAATRSEQVFVARGTRALCCVDGEWLQAVRVPPGATCQSVAWELRSGAGRDPRLLGDERDQDGARFLCFREVVQRAREVSVTGWPLKGQRAAKEAMLAVRDAGQEGWDDHHAHWARRSGIGEKTATAREHRVICMALRLLTQFDQVDMCGLASAELLVRRLRQLETATRRNPRQPDFDGLDMVLDTAVDDSGALVLPTFDAWVSAQQRAEATVLKAGREWRDEQAARAKGDQKGKKGEKTEGS